MPLSGQPLAAGCMRLSTEPGRDHSRAVATLHAALAAGVTLLDTADAYANDDRETGHNERLVAHALATWEGDASRVRVATKGGLTRPGGGWVANGRARHLAASCEASRRALGRDRLDLYQLHAPDPRTPLATSVRALAALQRDGLVERIGLCNVTRTQLDEARRVAEIAAVQVEISPWRDENLRNGIAEVCAAEGILLLAYRPLGGVSGARRLAADPVFGALARRLQATPAEVVLAWLRSLAPVIVPLPGPTRPEHGAALAAAAALRLTEDDLALIARRFPAGALLRTPRAARRPDAAAAGDVALVIGLPGAGKSTVAAGLAGQGYVRLNRDATGGRLTDLVPALSAALAAGHRRIVLDNTYGSRAARNEVIEAAWAHGVQARCLWLQTSLEAAQVNVCQRMVAAYGRLLEPAEMKAVARRDPGVFPPQVLFRHRRQFEPPDPAEGFARIDAVPFLRQRGPEYHDRALVLWRDALIGPAVGIGGRTPARSSVETLAGRGAVLRRYAAEGWRLFGLSWEPDVARGTATPEEIEARFARLNAQLGAEVDWRYCPHGDGPPVCWCRKPLPGLGVVLAQRHRLDPARCVYVGADATDRAFARALGFEFLGAEEAFAS